MLDTEIQWDYSSSDIQRGHCQLNNFFKFAKCAKSAKYSSSDIQHGRCPPQPTQTTVSTSSPKPLMSSEWPSVAASQGSQPACSWKNLFHPTFQGWGDFTHARIKRHILPPHCSNRKKGPREMEKIKWVDLKDSQFHSSYLSIPPLPLTVCFFQAGILFCTENAKFWHILAI